MRYSVGVDIGGTKIAAGIVDEKKRILRQRCVSVKEASSTDEIVSLIVGMIRELLAEAQISRNDVGQVGVAVPGTANRKTHMVEYANNLQYCQGNLIEQLEQQMECSISFENDANAAAWGEYLMLDEKPSSMVMITLGTGIGAGIILHGEIYHGVNDAAGEIGHMSIQMDGFQCNCGRRGCWEAYASATALGLQAREAMLWNRESKLWAMCQGNSEQVDAKAVIEGVRLEDPTASFVFQQYLKYLGIGVVNVINLLQPECIVIGGGLSNAGNLLLKPLQEMVKKESYSRNSGKNTDIRLAMLKNDAGILGAALLESLTD